MLNRPSITINKWVVVLTGALLALVAILVLSSPAQNGIFAHDPEPADHNADDHIHYTENDMGPVRNFTSKDPEGAGIEWNVRGVDAADFEISSVGVLTFRESPDYENPTDRGLNLNPSDTDSDFTDTGEFAPDDNKYQITVSATEVRAAGANAPLPAERTDIELTVIVRNVNDPGEVTLQWLQPEVGTPIMATVTDPDGEISDTDWTWYTSKVADPEVGTDFHWNEVADTLVTAQAGEPTSSYTPQGDTVRLDTDVAVDEGKHLRVKVDYTDAHGTDKTIYGISMNPVRAEVSPGANASPDFEDDTDTRTVPESTAVGEPVGSPVTATDTDNDIVTYELIAAPSPNDGDDEFFDIDQASGQITVAQELDYDAVGDRTAAAVAGTYTVSVRATDPSGFADNITVTITAENVNEDPIVTGRAELSVKEGITDADDNLVYDRLPDAPGLHQPSDPTNQRNEYVYEEPDHLDSIARWHLEGDDAGAFDHSGRFEPRYLQFKEAPDYENPTDLNNDNVYEVTLVATDTDPLGTGAGIGKVNVWVTVHNAEEMGKVVFTAGETAYLNEMLVAEVQDPDDKGGDLGEPYQGVHIVNWQWSKSTNDSGTPPFEDIVGATTNRYTPRDMDRGYYLRATARYTDPLRTKDDPVTNDDERIGDGSLRIEMATTENAVRVAPGPESAPTFGVDSGDTVTRYVPENTMAGGNVGAPVAAMAANTNETLTYTLEGSDAQYFNIIKGMGQITVGTDTSFNYDDPENPNTYRVTVKVEVTGGDANQNAQVDVNIIVTDVDELPVITDPQTMVDYRETDGDDAPNTADVATYVGTDPEGDMISWDVRGADAALFTIDGGVLKFKAAPDYENPKDVGGANTATPLAMENDNEYNIVIRAIASRVPGDTGPAETVDVPVTVTVTDEDEDGEVVISWLQPEVGIEIRASLTDPDGPSGAGLPVDDTAITNAMWTWAVSEVVQGALNIDNDDHWGTAPGEGDDTNSYTPDGANLDDNLDDNDTPIDEDKYLRVTASYTDREGATKTARAISAYPVQARGLGEKNESPDFEGAKVELSVAETAEVGDDVPGPVVATVVAASSTDILTYGLRAVKQVDLTGITGVDLPTGDGTGPDDDLAAFDIDKELGQITVARKLDFESRGAVGNRDGKYVMVVTVTDPSGLGDTIVVVIEAEDMNEDPVLSGRPELTINEIDSSDENAANPDFDGNPEPVEQDPAVATVNVYNVVDEDRRAATEEWSLEGEDAGEFQLIGTVGRTLVFRNQPDYENPADANGDNVYKVTVVTFDGAGGRGEFDVCIAVMNINEAGKITLLDGDSNELVQPRAYGPITASLTDPDGGVTGLIWQWSKAQVDPPTTQNPRTEIPTATSPTYMPTNDDTSFFLHAAATYRDAKNNTTTDTATRAAVVTAAHAVLEVEDQKRPPAFPQDVTEVEVAENSPSTTYVGEALGEANDPDIGTTLTYTLVGDDAKYFALAPNTRQIVVGHPTILDKEDDKKNTYTVELKASDGALSDTLMVTITVTDRNEAPSMPVEAKGAPAPDPDANNAPVFPDTETGAREVAENTAAGENIGAPVMATDADAGDTLTYELGGTDMASFTIDSATGQIMVGADPLDFETPVDADTDNAYEVTVTASDGNTADDAAIAVTVTVTDLAEGSELSPYDTDNSGKIEGPEVIQAVKDYFADTITGPQVIEVVKLYFAGRSN